MTKIPMILGLFVFASAAAEASGARSVVCNAFPKAIHAGMGLTQGTWGDWHGTAVHNFDHAALETCDEPEPSRVPSCEGRWASNGAPARLTVHRQPDGTFKGTLTLASGEERLMGCLLSHDPLQ